MTYRDDADAMFERATALQREVDELREQLAARDRKPAQLGATSELPGAAAMIDRLLEQAESTEQAETSGRFPRFPAREPISFLTIPDLPPPPLAFRREAVIERMRDLAGALSDEHLVMIGAIVEALASDRWSAALLDDLRALASLATRSR